MDQKISLKSSSTTNQASYQQSLFLSLALDMTWQLAIVFIIPIVGGYLLDKRFHTSPWLTLAGFIVAAAGTFGVLSHVVSRANQRNDYHNKADKT
jgi:F0F1-type ATP synthase assembly protein I